MSNSIPSVNVGSFDLGNLSDSDLGVSSRKTELGQGQKSSFAGYLDTPAKYELEITDVKETKSVIDGAGKQWKSLLVTAADVQTGKLIRDFVTVPVETALYTNKNGATSSVKSKIFASLMKAITGNQVTVANLQTAVLNASNVIAAGARFEATTKYKDNYIKYLGKNAEGEIQLGLVLAATGEAITDDLGEPLTFSSRDAAAEYHRQVFGRSPATGMGFVSFLPKKRAA